MGKRKPSLRFKGFEGEWEHRKLGEDIADIVGGGTPCTSNPTYWDGDIDWYSPTEIGDNIYANGSIKRITELGLKKSSAKMLPENRTILFTSRAGIGDMAILQRSGTTNQGFQSLVLREGYNPYFIYSAGFLIKKYALKNSSGSTFLEISGINLGKMTLSVPEFEEQTKIGDYFKQLDTLITQQQRKYDSILNVKKSMLEKMFPKDGADVPEIRFKGFEGKWDTCKFGDCVLIQRGGSPRPIDAYITKDEDGINWIKIGDVAEDSRYITSTKEKIKPEGESKSRRVFKGDLILSNSMSFGRPYIMQIEGCIHDGWLLIRDEKKMFDTEYLLQLLSSEYMFEQYKSLASGGVVNNLNSTLVQSTTIVYPHTGEQTKIGNLFKHLDTLLTQHQKKLDHLKHIKSALLEKMFVPEAA